MYRILFSLLLLVSACSNNCQDLIDEITSAKLNYENSATETNCIAYQSALQSYLNSTCQNPQGVNYNAIFQNYLDDLACDTLPTNVSSCSDGIQNGSETGVDCGGSDCNPCSTAGTTCTDGIQNGNETGVDCGGTCPPCSSTNNYYMTCEIDGVPWSAISGGLFPLVVTNGTMNGYTSFLNEGQIRIRNADNFSTTGTYVFTTGSAATLSSGEASFSHSPEAAGSTSIHYYVPTGSAGNGSLVVTDVNLVDSTVTGTFTVTAYDDNFTPYDTISVTNGEFYLPFE